MKYLERIKISYRMAMSFEEFLQQDSTLLWLAEQADMTPADFLVSELIPEAGDGEAFQDWLLRHVKECLEAQLWRDSSEGYGDAGGVHFSRHVDGVEFSPQDKEFILRTFSDLPEVKNLWVEAQQAPAAKTAA